MGQRPQRLFSIELWDVQLVGSQCVGKDGIITHTEACNVEVAFRCPLCQWLASQQYVATIETKLRFHVIVPFCAAVCELRARYLMTL
jgi:hypothetical protein